MSKPAFPGIEPIRYQPDAPANALAFRYYDKDKKVRGKRMEDHLRMAVCYWHTFVWNGFDVFGAGTFGRQWHREGDAVELAKEKAAAAFELFSKLGVPFFCFHDRDVAPEGKSLAETNDILDKLTDVLEAGMKQTGVKLLWGTANLFSHPRYMGGAATNPDPEVFTYAAAQVKKALDVTKRLGGENYVLWGGREGYETLLNTDMKKEVDQLGRFMNLVVDYKHKIGFKGPLLIEASRTREGTLALRGPMAPRFPFPPGAVPAMRVAVDANGFVDTFYPCRVAGSSGALTVTGPPAGVVSMGGYRFILAGLQEAVSQLEPGAMLAAFPDGLAGQRVAGIAVHRDAIRDALTELGLNPLVINAFRPRRGGETRDAA